MPEEVPSPGDREAAFLAEVLVVVDGEVGDGEVDLPDGELTGLKPYGLPEPQGTSDSLEDILLFYFLFICCFSNA